MTKLRLNAALRLNWRLETGNWKLKIKKAGAADAAPA
jgi:hypothetical protein